MGRRRFCGGKIDDRGRARVRSTRGNDGHHRYGEAAKNTSTARQLSMLRGHRVAFLRLEQSHAILKYHDITANHSICLDHGDDSSTPRGAGDSCNGFDRSGVAIRNYMLTGWLE